MKFLMAWVVGALTLFGSDAWAAKKPNPGQAKKKPAAKRTADSVFQKMDKNNDGKVSMAEWTDARKGRKAKGNRTTEQVFARIDSNKDGSVTAQEFKTALDSRKKKKK